jgi:uncharacterized membrane protein YkgB
MDSIDARITDWMARHAVKGSRVSLGLVFFWFGALKLFPGFSPAEDLVGRTILVMTGGLIEPWLSVPGLGIWESLIGLGLLTGRALRSTLLLLFAQMAGTFTPVVLFPGEVFARFPIGLTFEGQYIVKNVVLISAALVIGATVRGGALHSQPASAGRVIGHGRFGRKAA